MEITKAFGAPQMQTATAQKAAVIVTDEHQLAGIQWLVDISGKEKWNLSTEEITDLLGGISVRKYQELKRKAANNLPVNLRRDTIERISILLGIHKGLSVLAPENRKDMAYAWFNKPSTNQLFNGKSIKQYLIDRKTVGALYDTRRYLEATACYA